MNVLKQAIFAILMLAILFIVGCSPLSSEPKGDGLGNGQQLDMGAEEREAFLADRLSLAIVACEDKVEGDSCVTTTPRGSVDATCTLSDENLVCGQVGSGTKNLP